MARHLFEADGSFSTDTSAASMAYFIMGPSAVDWLAARRTSLHRQEKLAWSRLYVLGCSPAEVRARGGIYDYPVADSWIEHPLHTISMLLLSGRHQDAIAALNEYREIRATGETRRKTSAHTGPFPSGFFPQYMSTNIWGAQPVCPIDPRDYGIDPLQFWNYMDRLGFAPWYEGSGIAKEFETLNYSHNLRMLRNITEVAGERWHATALTGASAFLRRTLASRQPNYEDVAFALRVLGDQAAQYLNAADRGTRAAAWCLVPAATSEQMKRGLAALAKMSESAREVLLERMGRAPTYEELSSIRSKGYVHILHRMPWKFLEAAATSEAGVASLRGKLAKYLKTNELEVIQTALIDHERRLQPADLPEPLTPHPRLPPEDTEWFRVYTMFEEARKANHEARARLLDVAEEVPAVALLLGLTALADTQKSYVLTRAITPSVLAIAEKCPGYAAVTADPDKYLPRYVKVT